MAVRFVGVIRVPLCARVSRVCPVCVPAPPVSFYRYRYGSVIYVKRLLVTTGLIHVIAPTTTVDNINTHTTLS
jgi:hypothetical protein